MVSCFHSLNIIHPGNHSWHQGFPKKHWCEWKNASLEIYASPSPCKVKQFCNFCLQTINLNISYRDRVSKTACALGLKHHTKLYNCTHIIITSLTASLTILLSLPAAPVTGEVNVISTGDIMILMYLAITSWSGTKQPSCSCQSTYQMNTKCGLVESAAEMRGPPYFAIQIQSCFSKLSPSPTTVQAFFQIQSPSQNEVQNIWKMLTFHNKMLHFFSINSVQTRSGF